MVGKKQKNNMTFKMKSSVQELCSPLSKKEFDPNKYLTRTEEEESPDLTRKGGPRVNNTERINKLKKDREKSNEIEHNVESKMDEYPDFHEELKEKKK